MFKKKSSPSLKNVVNKFYSGSSHNTLPDIEMFTEEEFEETKNCCCNTPAMMKLEHSFTVVDVPDNYAIYIESIESRIDSALMLEFLGRKKELAKIGKPTFLENLYLYHEEGVCCCTNHQEEIDLLQYIRAKNIVMENYFLLEAKKIEAAQKELLRRLASREHKKWEVIYIYSKKRGVHKTGMSAIIVPNQKFLTPHSKEQKPILVVDKPEKNTCWKNKCKARRQYQIAI